MGPAVRVSAAKGKMIESFASEMNQKRVQLLLGHGEHRPASFRVPEGQIIVFVARAGEQLPQKVIQQEFYNIFTSANALRKLLTTDWKDLPRFMRGWAKRTYGPGDTCPETYLELKDPCWKTAMGIHTLPLAYPLRSSKQFAGKNATPREVAKAKAIWAKRCGMDIKDPGMFYKSTKRTAEPRAGSGNGSTVRLSTLTGKGVLFVVACRVIKEEENTNWKSWVKNLNRSSLPVFMEKRKRTNTNVVNRDKNEKNRPKKRLKTVNTSNFLRQAEENRKKRELKAEKNRETLAKVKVLEKRILARK